MRGLLQGWVLPPLLLLLQLHLAFSSSEENPGDEGLVVRVAQGQLRGLRIQREENATIPALYAFQGIPYARAPTGSRRFKDPEEPESWNGVRNATVYGSSCVSFTLDTGDIGGNEDCLFLNIFTIDPPSRWRRHKRPVMVYFHGGAFLQGSGDMINNRPDPLLREGILFVSVNYRLGVLGFLNTEDSQAPGNAGLKDQVMSLRWVQRNIAAFGGDPTQVTIIGDSAGAGSVHYHILSPLSRGLFHRAISMSGSVIPIWALVDNPRQHAKDLRSQWSSSCPQDNEEDIVPCLQRVNPLQLFSSQFQVPEPGSEFFGPNAFRPSIEAAGSSNALFIAQDGESQLREGRFSRVPYMTGTVSSEGIIYLGFGRLFTNTSRWALAENNFNEIFRWTMPLGIPRTLEAAQRMRAFYLGNTNLTNANENVDTMNKFVQICTDVFFAEGTVQSARFMSERGSPVYVYKFSHDGPAGYWKRFLNATYLEGVTHGDDMFYIFDRVQDGRLPQYPASEQAIRERQAKLFANFGKTGNPTPPRSGLKHWPAFTPEKEKYMDMGNELTVHDHAMGERIVFWRSLMTPSTGPTPGRKA